jgi:hypothetical protein
LGDKNKTTTTTKPLEKWNKESFAGLLLAAAAAAPHRFAFNPGSPIKESGWGTRAKTMIRRTLAKIKIALQYCQFLIFVDLFMADCSSESS